MSKIELTDGSCWFDDRRAISYPCFGVVDLGDGIKGFSNLYFTRNNNWILHCWSFAIYKDKDFETYEILSKEEAFEWLKTHKHAPPIYSGVDPREA